MAKNKTITVQDVIKNWLRNRGTLEFLGTWEQINNSEFKVVESEHFKKDVGLVLEEAQHISNRIENKGL